MTRVLAGLLTAAFVFYGSSDLRQQIPPGREVEILKDFKARVDKYLEIRKTADNSAEPLEKTADPTKIRAAQQALAERVGAARRGAKHGDIFSPEISAYFRHLLRPETKAGGTKAAIKDDNPGEVPFKVNGCST